MKILSFSELESTNAYALDLATQTEVQSGTVIWATSQKAGRGQYGRSFASPIGGLYFSLILQPDLPVERLTSITLAAGLGCCLYLEQHIHVLPLLKWPNDLYIQKRKLGGILTQSLPISRPGSQTVVIGVGLNVNTEEKDIPLELRGTTVSLFQVTRRLVDLQQMLTGLVKNIESQVQQLRISPDKLLAQWHRRDYLRGQPVQWDNGRRVISGVGQGILSDGRYSLIDSEGLIHPILSGSLQPIHCSP